MTEIQFTAAQAIPIGYVDFSNRILRARGRILSVLCMQLPRSRCQAQDASPWSRLNMRPGQRNAFSSCSKQQATLAGRKKQQGYSITACWHLELNMQPCLCRKESSDPSAAWAVASFKIDVGSSAMQAQKRVTRRGSEPIYN